MPSFQRCLQLAAGIFLLGVPFAAGQNPPPAGPNADPIYHQLRNITLAGDAFTVENIVLKRDAATFHLHSGTICFVPPVQGKVTGAVFVGDGSMSLEAPSAQERRSLSMLTKSNEFAEEFNHLVMRFTDSTYEEIRRDASHSSGSCDSGLFRDSQNETRVSPVLKYNLDARILQDVLSSEPGGLFWAFIHGKRYDGKEIFMIDPHGARDVEPEEVELMTNDENRFGIWVALHLGTEIMNGAALSSQKNGVIRIDHQQLDTTIERNATLTGKAATTFVSQVNGLRVVPFNLFRTLRVETVSLEGGQPLSFIQEAKNDDADYSVILPKPLAVGEKCTIVTTYGGKEAVLNEGNGNFFPNPRARENWYPNTVVGGFGNFSSYDMTFHIPKGMKIAATGTMVSNTNDGKQEVSIWKSEVPQTVAGFSIGLFKMEEAKMTNPDYLVQSYANEEPPDWVKELLRRANPDDNFHTMNGSQPMVALGTMNTTTMIKQALAQGELSMQLYTNYFGPIPFKRLAMTQQTACLFGQSWPTLVWLPICSFFDSTVRHQLGLDFGDRGYWKVVGPHEVAHQWWGHEVGFSSYRDQWMSEGFADMSASLFIQAIEKNPKKFVEFWNDERLAITERNKEGFRAIDVGPLTMGWRLNNARAGENIYRELIYPKGAYILHMIRMMMWNAQTGDDAFKQLMHDFVKTYAGRSASTEDFKAMVEKHMTPDMNAAGNGKMDWFFNEYVYGTALPAYNFTSSFEKDASGKIIFNYKLIQSGVDDNFRMVVPVYFELADGRHVTLGHIMVKGNNAIEGKVPLTGIKDVPKSAVINYQDDVLASN
jgi:Peptidase family M1 domain